MDQDKKPDLANVNKKRYLCAMDISENIKILCKIRNLKINDLASRLNITRQTLHRQITGPANITSLQRIANALQVPGWILLHPAPLEALAQIQTDQAPGPACLPGTRPAVLFCPHCKKPIILHPATLEDSASQDQTGGQLQDQTRKDKE